MQLFEDNKKMSPIYHRGLSLTISKTFALEQNVDVVIAPEQGSEQLNRRRELLEVEEEANTNKIIKQHGFNRFKAQIMSHFFLKVNKAANTLFDNSEDLFSNVMNIEPEAAAILELLAVKAASIKRITPLIAALPWLADELVTLVNKPQYRKKADVQVTDANLAISYIGLDNLKLIVPTFILKHWLPISTSPFPLMKRKIWNDSLSVALAAQALAKAKEIDGFTAFCAGMLSNIGMLAVTNNFLRIYRDMHKEELREAYDKRDKRLHDVLVDVDSSPELLLEQLTLRSSKISAELVELMRFDRLAITEAIFDLAHINDFDNMCSVAQIVTQAKAYVTYRTLAKEDLISKEDASQFLLSVQLTSNDVNLLKKTDIDHIKLNFS